ncbi:MAG TPA: hypothetical protein VFV97_16795 [Rhodanobacteraceae bacterium]|nr:hypothetical protein [Rhodanobacteraceae bacterium]
MKRWPAALCFVLACGSLHAEDTAWQPAAGHAQIPLWPGTPPDSQPMPGAEYAKTKTDPAAAIAGKSHTFIRNVSAPTMTVYAPEGKSTGAAAIVFPGGAFEILAIDLEGTEICD